MRIEKLRNNISNVLKDIFNKDNSIVIDDDEKYVKNIFVKEGYEYVSKRSGKELVEFKVVLEVDKEKLNKNDNDMDFKNALKRYLDRDVRIPYNKCNMIHEGIVNDLDK
jgi:hypothetical protein